MNYYPRREQHPMDPDVAELMNAGDAELGELDPTVPSTVRVDSIETDGRSSFEQDFEQFVKGIDSWKSMLEKNMLSGTEDVPPDYRLVTNTGFSPYCSYLVKSLQLINRGSPLLLCREARDVAGNVLNYLVSIYAPKYANIHIVDFRSPASDLAFRIESGHFFPFFFDVSRIESARDASSEGENLDAFNFAERMGLTERAFMTSALIRHAGFEETLDMDESMDLYEKFASEVDENGKRRFTPLMAEEFGGLVSMMLQEAFGKDPTLNDRYELTKPFPVIEP